MRPSGSLLTDFSTVDATGEWKNADGTTGGVGTFSSSGELHVDFSGANVHVTGTLGAGSFGGFWIGFDCLDLSATNGIAFTISSATTLPGALSVVINNDPDTLRESGGSCYSTPPQCLAPGHNVTPGPNPMAVSIAWTDFTGGMPISAIDPSKVTALTFSFPYGASGSYAVDVAVDDVTFL
jgi:hypothetical protein